MFWKRQVKWLIMVKLYSPLKHIGVLTLKHIGVLTPSTVECHFIWREGLYKGNEVKMKSLG